MSEPLRILMLEDTQSDAELAEHKLRKAGIAFTAMRVESREAFVRALAEFHPDIVLSDYNLPDFNGLAALEIVQREHPEIPVIMVTGALADFDAVELIQAGAKDYVLKDRLARLAPAVQRALSAAQGEMARKQAEKALRESEAKFRVMVETSSDWVWEINDQGVYTYASPQVRDLLGYEVGEVIGKSPFDLMPLDEAEQVRERFKAFETERKPFRLLENANLHKNGRIVFLESSGAPVFDAQGVFRGYRGIDRDITERKQAEEERRLIAKRLGQTLSQTINAIAAMVEARDPYTAGHQRRVAALACAIAGDMGFSADRIHGLDLAATIHDLGKIRIPSEILSKPGQLSKVEYELIKLHPQAGYDIIKNVQFHWWPVAEMVLQHHERLDGSGYPQGLKGDQILPEANILAVADVVEAMMTHRPYRAGLGEEAALDEIVRNRGVLYDPAVVDSCIALFRDKKFEFEFN
ncbi:MAG: PAS domain S-box protein [Sideroxyarcus sp.]|nr:PAS domain S-box protein [Sideroxyarcus sp.]